MPEIFNSRYRLQVLRALQECTRKVIEPHQPIPLKEVIEIGCGTGFFYRYLASEDLKGQLVGYDNHIPSLDFFRQESPTAQVKDGNASQLELPDSSVNLILGFSAYPLLTQIGVIEELARVLRPEGKVIAFQDSPIRGPYGDNTTYGQMRRLEDTHTLLKQRFSRDGWVFTDGDDPVEAVVLSPYKEVEQRIQRDMMQKIGERRIILATSTDTGNNKIYASEHDDAADKFQQMKTELGSPRSLENITINFGEEILEYSRVRFVVATKTSHS